MDHNDIRHMLSDYLDNEVSPADKAAIETHLASCAECAEALRELRKTVEHMKTVEQIEPPAWMAQKIMARVREEEAKRGFLRRFFLGSAWMPLRATAVLFLAVTAAYIYYLQPSRERTAETPAGPTAQLAAPAAPEAMKKEIPAMTAPKERKAKHAPSYKSLDMKYSYETPAPPSPKDHATPQAAAPAPAPEPDAAKDLAGSAAPAKAPASAMDESETSSARRSAGKLEARPAQTPLPRYQLILVAQDVPSAAKETERLVAAAGGKVTAVRTEGATRALAVEMDGANVRELVEKLKQVGTVQELGKRDIQAPVIFEITIRPSPL